MSEFRLEVAVGHGLTALRRFGWLIGLVMMAYGGVVILLRILGGRWAFLGVDTEFTNLGIWTAQHLSAALGSAAVYLLTLAGARGQPLRPLKLLRDLLAGLLVILLAEGVYNLPPTIALEVFVALGMDAAAGAVKFLSTLYRLGLFLSLSLLVPAILDRRLGLSDGIGRSLALIKGRRWPLFLLVMAPLIAVSMVQRLLGAADPLADIGRTWPIILLTYPLYGLVPVVIASVYLESDSVNGEGPEQLAETFE